MGESRVAQRSPNGVACIAGLLGMVVLGLCLWVGVVWVARAFLPLHLS